MDIVTIGIGFFLLVLILLASGTWIFSALFLSSIVGLYFFIDFPLSRIGAIAKGVTWTSVASWEVAAVPLFIWMGEILFRTDVSNRLFRGLTPLVSGVPGGLLHANVLGCTLFAAVSGSSVATTATVGKITTKALFSLGYDRDISVGSLAGAGSLGMMIPPSLVMIVYGLLAEVSIAKLFIAGVLPGLMIAGFYMLYIGAVALARPGTVPAEGKMASFYERLVGLIDLGPVVLLMIMVLGGIYSGVVTPSEAAAVGVSGSILLGLLLRQLSFKILIDSLLGSIKTSCMVLTLLVAAAFLSSAMGFMHIPQRLAASMTEANLSPYMLIVILGVFYLVLGMFLEGLSITVMTLPITLPLIIQAGFDPIWFGVFLVIMIELAAVTPPVGFNLFVLDSLTGLGIYRIAKSAAPFFVLMAIAAIILTIFPSIALWLPSVVEL